MSAFDLSYQNQHLDGKIVAGLERIAEVFKVLLWDISKDYQLTPIQSQILIFLATHDVQYTKASYLSRELNVTKATISESLRILTKKELIAKIPNAQDKRSFHYTLTPKGFNIAQKLKNFTSPLEKILQTWTIEQQEIFFDLVLAFIHSLNQHGIVSVLRICFECFFYTYQNQTHFCQLLQKPLKNDELRIDCPEHTPKK